MKVAVAIITDEHQKILITQRAQLAPYGGLWEFPGGKLEPNELASSALIREIKEEVGLDVLSYNYLGEVQHAYGQNVISLLVYHVYDYSGDAVCLEAQMGLCWVDVGSLREFSFPAANLEIIELFKARVTA